MPTKRRYGSVTRQLWNRFWDEVIQHRGNTPEDEAKDLFLIWLDEKGLRDEYEADAVDYQTSAALNGMLRDRTKFVEPSEDNGPQLSILFPEEWENNGVIVEGGYVANPQMTPEHWVEAEASEDRRVEKALRRREVTRLRRQALMPGFDAGAETSKQALAILRGDDLCSTHRTAQDQHIGA
jgi:hypothetical protein